MVIVALIIIIHPALIVTDLPLWLSQGIAHLHEEDITEEVMGEGEDGK